MNQAFQALWTFLFMLVLFVLVLATAKSTGVIVFEGKPFDVATILLTAVALLMTCFGIGIAILAFWGAKEVSDLKAKAIDRAVEEASKKATDVAKPVAARAAMEYLQSQKDGDGSLSKAQVEEIVKAVSSEDGHKQ